MSALNESIVADAALAWFEELGYAIGHEPHAAPGELLAKATDPHLAEATP